MGRFGKEGVLSWEQCGTGIGQGTNDSNLLPWCSRMWLSILMVRSIGAGRLVGSPRVA